MPELPEVETVKRTLNALITGKQIQNVTVRLPRIIQRPDDIQAFANMLAGHTVVQVERRGKFLRFVLDGLVMVSHLRMEGRYGLYPGGEPLDKHTHVIFHFTDGTELRYTDVRQFGTMHLFQPGEDLLLPPLKKLGEEPLAPSFTPERFKEIVSGKSTKIKPLLLNQEYVVGIGNIYVDEALHRARIHPETGAKALTGSQLDVLHHAIVATLTEAVNAGGSSVKSYVNGQGESGSYQHQLLIYGRKDQPCASCGTLIEKTVVGGRGTHYCPSCQPQAGIRK
ncbi:DNA-formamidopyrimidine glycosylase [Paenibacillus jilunlii]|uniref:Formamidopyrimidine-DNA glycosylase n=1 Tax=Paenibacillus jilunlii TaxID=682956 RepID=A0A1G9FSK0_9BACL|nr:DNA-formamidopyrimidine glycosylase [Paenibacillus jilunlii]KWX71219.1 5-hydroxymethyluracil DNA glycosylase [Paenibacillus jilunlii]SDK91384.1 DNA-(apurinic or apyrimidinic site) lyase [Paenibacillus jilunlii]